jgi:hypothetical protein
MNSSFPEGGVEKVGHAIEVTTPASAGKAKQANCHRVFMLFTGD